jgi:hypothetical protein
MMKTTLHKAPHQAALADAIEVLGNGRFALLLIPIILGLMIAGGGWITWHDYGLFLLFWFGTQVIWDRLVQDAASEAPWYGQKLRVGNAPFLVYLLVLSLFWAVYNQIFLTFPLYIQDFVNTSDAVRDRSVVFRYFRAIHCAC